MNDESKAAHNNNKSRSLKMMSNSHNENELLSL